ncbi:hypothetical protein CF326_g6382 [Tilletia indica]|nr:hypothetical protein CF326_g6382 [Tilletia indica]
MLPALVKPRSVRFLLLLLASTALHAVVATPLAVDTDASSSLLNARATGKYVGATCTTNEECYSKNCVLFGGATQKTCRRQPAGGPCVENNNCGSRVCVQGKCSASALTGACDTVSDCADAANTLCQAGKCTASSSTSPAQRPNTACNANSDCASGQCQAIKYCLDSTGKEGPCSSCFPGTGLDVPCVPSPLHCTRLPLNAQCTDNGDCSEGFCRSGICTASRTGDACVSEAQCTGTSICGTRGTCYTPSKGTLYPQDICGANSQCSSGRCLSGLNFTSSTDQIYEYSGKYTYPTRCDFLDLGETRCRTYVDCDPGICKNSVCVLGANGDRCLFNQHCANLCGSDGICRALPPKGSVLVKQPCTADDQCVSGKCETDFISRPLPYNSGSSTYVMDKVCSQAPAGISCSQDSDCQNSACRNNVCTVLQLGESCSSFSQCATKNCPFDAATGSKVCATGATRYPCQSNSSCFSNSCVSNPTCDATSTQCDPNRCAPVATLDTCRNSDDCDLDNASCDTDSKCRINRGKTCSAGDQCLSRSCISGKCA